jgi:hypothetical protein
MSNSSRVSRSDWKSARNPTINNCPKLRGERNRYIQWVLVYRACPSTRWMALPIRLFRRETTRRRMYSQNWFRTRNAWVFHYKSVDKLAVEIYRVITAKSDTHRCYYAVYYREIHLGISHDPNALSRYKIRKHYREECLLMPESRVIYYYKRLFYYAIE